MGEACNTPAHDVFQAPQSGSVWFFPPPRSPLLKHLVYRSLGPLLPGRNADGGNSLRREITTSQRTPAHCDASRHPWPPFFGWSPGRKLQRSFNSTAAVMLACSCVHVAALHEDSGRLIGVIAGSPPRRGRWLAAQHADLEASCQGTDARGSPPPP
eukprot:scaffold1239_cov175-Pinguiococcus_pyrenoidosus.AAC.30